MTTSVRVHRVRRPARRAAVMAVAVALGVACGGDDDDDNGAAPLTTEATSVTSPDTATASAPTTDASAGTTAAPSTDPPSTDAETTTADTAADDPLAPAPLADGGNVTVLMSGKVEAFLGVLLAEELGEFEKEGIDVEVSIVPATESPLLVATGRGDVAMSNLSAGNLNLIADGNPLRVVFGGSIPNPEANEGFWVHSSVPGEDGFQPHDLQGATLATSFGEASSVIASLLADAEEMEPGGLAADQLVHQTMSLPDGMAALMNGAVDAAMSVQPFSTQLGAAGCCEYIGMWPTFSTSAVLMGPTLLEEDRDLGLAFTRAVARTVRDHLQGDYHKDPELSPVIATLLEQPLDSFQASYSPIWNLRPSYESLTEPQDYYFEVGELLSYDTPLTPEQVFDLEFLDQLEIEES